LNCGKTPILVGLSKQREILTIDHVPKSGITRLEIEAAALDRLYGDSLDGRHYGEISKAQMEAIFQEAEVFEESTSARITQKPSPDSESWLSWATPVITSTRNDVQKGSRCSKKPRKSVA